MLAVVIGGGLVARSLLRQRDTARATPAGLHTSSTTGPDPVVKCDPAAQTGCAPDEKCDLFCADGAPTFACRKDEGKLAIGQACEMATKSGPETCPKGATCFSSFNKGTLCMPYCSPSVPCPTGKCVHVEALIFCAPDPTKNKPFGVDVCQ
jgi:hypothetical protein